MRLEPTEQESLNHDPLRWLATHEDLMREYQGEWVALVGEDVVAHSPSFLELMQQVETRRIENPFLVPVAADQPFIG